jgi:hypothetical protein
VGGAPRRAQQPEVIAEHENAVERRWPGGELGHRPAEHLFHAPAAADFDRARRHIKGDHVLATFLHGKRSPPSASAQIQHPPRCPLQRPGVAIAPAAQVITGVNLNQPVVTLHNDRTGPASVHVAQRTPERVTQLWPVASRHHRHRLSGQPPRPESEYGAINTPATMSAPWLETTRLTQWWLAGLPAGHRAGGL